MKTVLLYWVIGCVIVGSGEVDSRRGCGVRHTADEMISVVAVWPVLFVFAARGLEPDQGSCVKPDHS